MTTRGITGRWTSLGRKRLISALASGEHSLSGLAKWCGVTPAAISALATGTNRYPSLPVALGLRGAGVGIEDWVIDNRLEGDDEFNFS